MMHISEEYYDQSQVVWENMRDHRGGIRTGKFGLCTLDRKVREGNLQRRSVGPNDTNDEKNKACKRLRE